MLKVEISEEETIEKLENLVKNSPLPYVREKASAVLKVYGGLSATQVAKQGLLQQRHPQTVRTWIHEFNSEGISSFYINLGRGRKPCFFPKSEVEVSQELRLLVLHERPDNQSRPTLEFLQQASEHLLGSISIPTLHSMLKKMGITYQRGRPYIHSPDEEYEAKLDYLKEVISLANQPDVEILFQDEFTLTNKVGSAAQFAPNGEQPLERWAWEEKAIRIAGAMNALTGQTTIYQCKKMTVDHFICFLQKVTLEYPEIRTIYMPIDGWPIHFHPSVQAALQPQSQPFEFHLPPSWKNVRPNAKYSNMNLPIQMVSLPTYASWLNPIEKLWKLLKKDVTHLFPFPNNFNELLARADRFFSEFDGCSKRLLQFCGLLKIKGMFYEPLLKANAPFLKPQVIF